MLQLFLVIRIVGISVRTMPAASLATVTTPDEKRSRKNH
jgi:hypothetical protein